MVKKNDKNEEPTSQDLFKKLSGKAKKAYEQHKADPIETGGFVNLPGELEGIAQLVDCRVGVYKKGKYEGELFFLAAAVIDECVPEKTKAGIPLKGQRTQIMQPLHATDYKTEDEQIKAMMNELKKLGVPTEEVEFEDLPDIMDSLKEQKPHIIFTTSTGKVTPQYPTPRIWENWQGITTYDGDEESGDDDLEDDSEDTPSKKPSGGAVKTSPKAKAKTASKPAAKPATKAKAPAKAAKEDDDEGMSLAELAKLSDGKSGNGKDGNTTCQAALQAKAFASGLTEDEISEAANWTEVAELIQSKLDGDEESSEAIPEIGDVFNYAGEDCEVIYIDEETQAVNLQQLSDSDVLHENVGWAELA